MSMKILWALVMAWWALIAAGPTWAAAAGRGDLTQHVDPFIGTDGTGHVTPAAMVPFGMVAPGPDNADRGWSYSSGYQYRAPRILGFSNTHISGAGIPEFGDVLGEVAAARKGGPDRTGRAQRPPSHAQGQQDPDALQGLPPLTTSSPSRLASPRPR